MGASPPEPGRARSLITLAVFAWGAFGALGAPGAPGRVAAQELATPTLTGTAFVGDSTMAGGTVVLHHLTDGTQGELDSLAIGADGSFSFRLPRVPDPARSDVYFASVRHDGVLYFGPAITAPIQLDSLYEVHAYDTLVAPPEGATVAIQSRSIFFEPDTVGWRVTDLFQIRNDEPRTIVTLAGGKVWSHPLPAGISNVSTGEGELALDAASYENGDLVVRAALPPGERLFVLRYHVDSPLLTIPNGQPAEALDVLIREPAPAVEVEGLELLDRIELEAGSTYLRFTGVDITAPSVRIFETDVQGPPPVEWISVLLAFVLAGAGLLILRHRPAGSNAESMPVPTGSGAVPAPDREALLLEIARLDEDFEARQNTPAQVAVYQRRRVELLRRVRAAD